MRIIPDSPTLKTAFSSAFVAASFSTLRRMPGPHPQYENLRTFDHPLIQNKLTRARDRRTDSASFRRLLNEIAGLMTFEVSRHFEAELEDIETPLEPTTGLRLSQPVTLVPMIKVSVAHACCH